MTLSRAAQAAKYAGERCCVCGKYGAQPPFGEPLENLIRFALASRLTLKLPKSKAVHAKCLKQLKMLIEWKKTDVTRIQT